MVTAEYTGRNFPIVELLGKILIVVSVLPRVTCGILSQLFSRDGTWKYWEKYFLWVILDNIVKFQFYRDVSCEI